MTHTQSFTQRQSLGGHYVTSTAATTSVGRYVSGGGSSHQPQNSYISGGDALPSTALHYGLYTRSER